MKYMKKAFKINTYFFQLLIAVIVTFTATYFSLPKSLMSTLPSILVASLIIVLIRIPFWQKLLLFVLFAFINATIEYNTVTALFYMLFCVLTFLTCSVAFHLFKKRKVILTVFAVILVILCAIPHSFIFGNIFEGMRSEKIIRHYVNQRYSSSEMVVSGTYYSLNNRYYKATIYSKKMPTEVYSLYVHGNNVIDTYIPFAQTALMNDRMLEITSVLRERFENDRFEVIPIEICGYPFDRPILLSDNNDYNSLMRFKIKAPGFITKAEFLETSEKYYNILVSKKIRFREIIFTGGGLYGESMYISVPYGSLEKNFSGMVKPSHLRASPISRDIINIE